MKSPMRMRREAAGLTQGEMGDLIGISGAQYSRYERAPETMTVGLANVIAKTLGCNILDLVNPSQLAAISGATLVEPRRTVPVIAVKDVAMFVKEGPKAVSVAKTFSPHVETSAKSFAVIMPDRSMEIPNGGTKTINFGDTVCFDPSVVPLPGNIVVAVDPASNLTVIRLYYPLHPTDARSPGYLLKAGNPEFPEIYVSGNGGVLAVAVERGLSLR